MISNIAGIKKLWRRTPNPHEERLSQMLEEKGDTIHNINVAAQIIKQTIDRIIEDENRNNSHL